MPDSPEINVGQPSPEQAARLEDIMLTRLDSQVAWYDRRSASNRRYYKSFKTLIITSAAAIPVLTTSGVPHGPHIAAVLGVMIAILEGVQQLNQYQANWATYRSAAEALKHEKYFYLARAGTYQDEADPRAMLAERIESIIAQENAKWLMGQTQSTLQDPSRSMR